MIVALPDHALIDAVGDVDGVEMVVWNGTGPAPADVGVLVAPYRTAMVALRRLDELPALRVVQTQLAGFDGQLELLPTGVTLCNAAGVHDDATAEHAVGLTLASLRRTPDAVRAHGHWTNLWEQRALADSRVMILGYGGIGRAVAERLLPMKASLTVVASRARDDDLLGRVHGVDDLAELLPEQDVVIVLLPLSEHTRGFVDQDFLDQLPDGALVVNVARGPVVDTSAVINSSERLRFALDVTDPEPLPDDHPLWRAPNVLITPHVAGGTSAMLPRIADLVRDQLCRYVAGEPLRNVVSA